MTWTNGGRTRTTTPEHRARRLRVLKRDRNICQIRGPRCTRHATVADHVIALALGGKDTEDNMQAACEPCNQWKAAYEGNQGRARRRNRKRPAAEPIGSAWGTTPPPPPPGEAR